MDVDVSEQANSTSLLDFLNIQLAQQQSSDTNEHNGHIRPDASGQNNNTTYEENTQHLSVDEVFGRELAALLTQSANNINTSTSSDLETAGPFTLPTNAASNINTNGDVVPAPATQEEQPHEHEYYLSGLAAVLQAAQAMQTRSVVKTVPAFHSLNAESDSTQVNEQADGRVDTHAGVSESTGEGPGGEGLSNDFSDLLAHLTAQLEQASEQNAPTEEPIASTSAGETTESYNFFAPTSSSILQAGSYYTSASRSVAAPSSGTVPYYSGVFGISGPKPSAAGSSNQGDQDSAADGKEKAKRRRRRKAGEKKSFPCEYGCDKTFGRKSDALRHARIHTGDRPFLCPYTECGKAFIQRSALHVHLRVHSGDKPHMCEYPLCGATFSDSSSLARHRRTHTGRRPYACERPDCAKTFTRRTALTAHMRTHDPMWEPDPRKRYSFKPKRQKTDGGEEDEEEGGREDAATLETLSSLLSQAGPDGTLPPFGVNSEFCVEGGRNGTMNANAPLEARVAAISAEIAAAIAQAQIQAQLDDDEDEDEDEEGESDEDEDDEEEGQNNGNISGIAHGMNVSGIRTEQPAPRPENIVPPSPVDASVAAPVPPLAEYHVSSILVEEDDFPVPLRERKCKPTGVVSAGSKRKR